MLILWYSVSCTSACPCMTHTCACRADGLFEQQHLRDGAHFYGTFQKICRFDNVGGGWKQHASLCTILIMTCCLSTSELKLRKLCHGIFTSDGPQASVPRCIHDKADVSLSYKSVALAEDRNQADTHKGRSSWANRAKRFYQCHSAQGQTVASGS